MAVIICLGGKCIKFSVLGYQIDVLSHRNILASYMVWLMATRTAKLLPHLWYTPQHIIYVPAFIAFGYYFSIMKLYALFTLHEVSTIFFLLRQYFTPR